MGYPHPEVVYRQLASGDAERIRMASESLRKAASSLDDAAGASTAGTKALDRWKGQGASAFADRAGKTTASISSAHEALRDAKSTIDGVAETYRSMRGSADKLIGFYRAIGAMVGGAANAQLEQQISKALVELRTTYTETLNAHARTLRGLRPGFESVVGDSSSWQRTAPKPMAPLPPKGTDPKKVAKWWASLSERERDQLLARRANELGRLNGLPADVLDTANRRRIEVDQQTFAMRALDLDARVRERAEELGIDPTDENAMRESQDPRLAELLKDKAFAERKADNAQSAYQNVHDKAQRKGDEIGAETYVLTYDPEGPGRKGGGLAVAFGNPDTADNVALTVPGTGTTLDSDFTGQAANLKEQMDASSPGSSNATVAWMNYDAPEWDWSVADDQGAKEGGQRLVADVDGYRAAADAAGNGGQHLTAIGHSYGSSTVGYAGMNGLAADDIALVGSPGAGASSAEQLSAGPGHVWAGGNEHDPVIQGTNGSYFTEGGDPSGPYDPEFGAHQFATDGGENIADAHTTYYDKGSDSLDNLGHIATGQYDQVTQQDPLEAPVAPDGQTGNPLIDTAQKIRHESLQVIGHAANGEPIEAAEDVVDAGVSTVGTVTDTAGEIVKDAAKGLTGILW